MSGDSTQDGSIRVDAAHSGIAHTGQVGLDSAHAVYRLTADGSISSWSDIAVGMYGYENDEVVGESFTMLLSEPESETGDIVKLLGTAREHHTVTEQWHERADGSIFWCVCTLSPLDDGTGGYRVVCQDTTAWYEHVRDLERQNDLLKEFTDVLAHDLRNPLSVITSHLEFYWRNGEDEHVAKIDETADRMNDLIDDLLRVARNGDVVRDPGEVDLEPLVETAAEGTIPASATLEYDPVPPVLADRDRLCELLENLLRNAVEHGGETVTVSIGPLDDGFFVADDGPGIPEADRQHVFEHGFSTQDDGTGIGLSVVSTIVGAHGWEVDISDGPTGGARFEITGIECCD